MSEILEILGRVGAIVTDSHFVLTSGKHSDTYINKDALYPHTRETSRVCRMMAERSAHLEIDAVVGPALGGIILSQWTAHHLCELKGKKVLALYTEESQDQQIFRRGYGELVAGKKVLVVEDLITTGGSARKVVYAVRSGGGQVAAVCVMVNRNSEAVSGDYFGAPYVALAEMKVEAYAADECPLCRSGVPVNVTLAHGREYVRRLS